MTKLPATVSARRIQATPIPPRLMQPIEKGKYIPIELLDSRVSVPDPIFCAVTPFRIGKTDTPSFGLRDGFSAPTNFSGFL